MICSYIEDSVYNALGSGGIIPAVPQDSFLRPAKSLIELPRAPYVLLLRPTICQRLTGSGNSVAEPPTVQKGLFFSA